MILAIGGLTAVGKTTHLLLFAKRLGLPYVSASQELLALLRIENLTNDAWLTSKDSIASDRASLSVDRKVDELVMERVARLGNAVVDSWAFPYLAPELVTHSLWLDESDAARVRKGRFSHSRAVPPTSDEEMTALINEKDIETAEIFRTLYGIELLSDRTPFRRIISPPPLTSRPTLDDVRKNIAHAHLLIRDQLAL